MTAFPIYWFEGEYAFLSNFYPLPDGLTLEHYYQAAKTLDPQARTATPASAITAGADVLSAPTPGKAKRLGQKAPLRPNWDEMRVNITPALHLRFVQVQVCADCCGKSSPIRRYAISCARPEIAVSSRAILGTTPFGVCVTALGVAPAARTGSDNS